MNFYLDSIFNINMSSIKFLQQINALEPYEINCFQHDMNSTYAWLFVSIVKNYFKRRFLWMWRVLIFNLWIFGNKLLHSCQCFSKNLKYFKQFFPIESGNTRKAPLRNFVRTICSPIGRPAQCFMFMFLFYVFGIQKGNRNRQKKLVWKKAKWWC